MKIKLLLIISFLVLSHLTAPAQTTAFNFQGRLNNGGAAANGNYDLRFKLFDAITGGTDLGSIDRLNSPVINGVFGTVLDFGPLAFQSVGNRFIEISVRPAGSPNAFVILGSRQQILSVPFAFRSVSATNAENAATATTAQNANSLGGVVASNYARLNFANQGEIASATGLATGGNITVGGNAIQLPGSNGFVKAMVVVNDDLVGQTISIERCYNGITGASTGNCGFAVSSSMDGVYQVNFGFPVSNRFVSAIARYNSGGGNIGNNIGANYQFPSTNPSVVEIFTFESGNSDDTTRADFTLIVY